MVNNLKKKKTKLKTGDTVRVILGKDRGKLGKILAVIPRSERVIVDAIGMVKKHIRARRAGEKGQRVSVASAIPWSNVQLICPACKKGTRIGILRGAGVRTRVCKKCSADMAS